MEEEPPSAEGGGSRGRCPGAPLSQALGEPPLPEAPLPLPADVSPRSGPARPAGRLCGAVPSVGAGTHRARGPRRGQQRVARPEVLAVTSPSGDRS